MENSTSKENVVPDQGDRTSRSRRPGGSDPAPAPSSSSEGLVESCVAGEATGDATADQEEPIVIPDEEPSVILGELFEEEEMDTRNDGHESEKEKEERREKPSSQRMWRKPVIVSDTDSSDMEIGESSTGQVNVSTTIDLITRHAELSSTAKQYLKSSGAGLFAIPDADKRRKAKHPRPVKRPATSKDPGSSSQRDSDDAEERSINPAHDYTEVPAANPTHR